MPALNFKKEFARAVETGEKRQTVRAHRKDGRPHCKQGDTIKLYTGMRTKSCRLLAEATVLSIKPVRIEATEMWLDGQRLHASIFSRDQFDPTDNEFAQADGFTSFMDLSDWFRQVHGLPFEGVVIRWDEPR